MFTISKNIKLNEEIFFGSKIYTIDNFYKYPQKILNFFLENKPPVHKKQSENLSLNQIYFDDRRHKIKSNDVSHVYEFLSKLCGQKPFEDNLITTNFTRFKKSKFNDYVNNYWWPHRDPGYSAIIYLNENDEQSGTNLYLDAYLKKEIFKYTDEHFCPWIDKSNFKLIKTLNPKFNRLILFDALKFVHGMNICNDYYFNQIYRMNQIYFFKSNKNYIYS